MEKEDQLQEFFSNLFLLSERQIELLKNFEQRFEATAAHRVLISDLTRATKRLFEGDFSAREKLDHLRTKIKMEISQNFSLLIEYKRELDENAVNNERVASALANMLQHDVNFLRKELVTSPELRNTEAKEKLEKISENLFKAVEAETELKSLDRYYSDVLEKFKSVLEKQRSILKEELAALDQLEVKDLDVDTRIRVQGALKKVAWCVVRLDDLMKEEKVEVQERLEKVLEQKGDIEERMRKLIEIKSSFFKKSEMKISAVDLQRDLTQFVTPHDKQAYLASLGLFSQYFDKSAEKFYWKKNFELQRNIQKKFTLLGRFAETSFYDHLTKLYNKRAFDDLMVQKITEGQRYEKGFSFLLLDIDNFHTFNKSYGHGGGDKILKLVGMFLKQAVRKTDIVFRFGGEEFAVLFPETNLEAAHKKANEVLNGLVKASENWMVNLNAEIKEEREGRDPWDITHAEKNNPFKINHVSFSGGLVAFDPSLKEEHGEVLDKLVKKSSLLMNKAKDQGRKRVIK